jgi:hypothetical protein
MNLTELNEDLFKLTESLRENNRRHYDLNNSLLQKDYPKDGSIDIVVQELGLISDLSILINIVKSLVVEQATNISITEDLILRKDISIIIPNYNTNILEG